jgi:hypothetical protein
MPKYRIDAMVHADNGSHQVLQSHRFEADSAADAERIADEWAKAEKISVEASLRVVCSDLILAERRMGQTKWLR